MQCPPVPPDINEVQIDGTFAQSYLGERYVLHVDNNEGVAIFSTDTFWRWWGRAQHYPSFLSFGPGQQAKSKTRQHKTHKTREEFVFIHV